MNKQEITAIIVEPKKHPRLISIINDADNIKSLISRDATYPCNIDVMRIEKNIAILYNRYAALIDLEGNRQIGNYIITGVFFIVETNKNGKLVSMSNFNFQKYTKKFWNIEYYSDDEVSESFWNDYEKIIFAP